ncbi:MAG: hypothetical protein K2Q18_08115 [Bdellovibrionales bacterium]|nr:hypothetical protein [Bdellovibrionales bacterium]
MTSFLKSKYTLFFISLFVVLSLLFKAPLFAAGWYYERGFGASGCDTYTAGPFGSAAICSADRGSYLASCSGPCCGMYTTTCSY